MIYKTIYCAFNAGSSVHQVRVILMSFNPLNNTITFPFRDVETGPAHGWQDINSNPGPMPLQDVYHWWQRRCIRQCSGAHILETWNGNMNKHIQWSCLIIARIHWTFAMYQALALGVFANLIPERTHWVVFIIIVILLMDTLRFRGVKSACPKSGDETCYSARPS